MAIAEENPGNHVYTQPGASSSSEMARSYAGSTDWESYRYEAEVKLDQFYQSTSWITLYARYLDSNNYYLLEIQGSPDKGYIALKKKVDGTVIPLQEKIGWYPPLGEWLQVDFVVNGIEIEVYIDGQLVLSGTDYELTHGAIAAALYQLNISIDDVSVTEITNPVEGEPLEPDPNHEPGTFYVSPTGSDYNPGTGLSPWKTMAKAADTAQQGDTVIFEDGTYTETRPAIFLRSGTENERIVFKARNKHQAVIVYQNMPTTKIVIKSAYITLQGLEITQNTRGIDTTDILVRMMAGADHAVIKGNKIHNAYEEGVKAGSVINPAVEENIIYDTIHVGIDFVGVTQGAIHNNEIYDIGRGGILVKGGSSDIPIYNNYIHNHNRFMFLGAIYLGGTTTASSSLDPSVNGFETWNLVAYNNVIIGDVTGGNSTIDKGIDFEGSKDSAAYNNLIVGTNYGIYLASEINEMNEKFKIQLFYS